MEVDSKWASLSQNGIQGRPISLGEYGNAGHLPIATLGIISNVPLAVGLPGGGIARSLGKFGILCDTSVDCCHPIFFVWWGLGEFGASLDKSVYRRPFFVSRKIYILAGIWASL